MNGINERLPSWPGRINKESQPVGKPPSFRPAIMQTKAVTVPTKQLPAASPIARPQAVDTKVLQAKMGTPAPGGPHSRPAPAAPPVYRPELKKVVQPKITGNPRDVRPPVRPLVYPPQPTPKVVQPKKCGCGGAGQRPGGCRSSQLRPSGLPTDAKGCGTCGPKPAGVSGARRPIQKSALPVSTHKAVQRAVDANSPPSFADLQSLHQKWDRAWAKSQKSGGDDDGDDDKKDEKKPGFSYARGATKGTCYSGAGCTGNVVSHPHHKHNCCGGRGSSGTSYRDYQGNCSDC